MNREGEKPHPIERRLSSRDTHFSPQGNRGNIGNKMNHSAEGALLFSPTLAIFPMGATFSTMARISMKVKRGTHGRKNEQHIVLSWSTVLCRCAIKNENWRVSRHKRVLHTSIQRAVAMRSCGKK